MNIKTPGVYIKDASPLLPSVAQIETGLPVFIGYTERALDLEGSSYDFVPVRIRDMGEFQVFFGGAYRVKDFEAIVEKTNGNQITDIQIPHRFFMFDCVRHFFENGGGDCYIISVGHYMNQFRQPNPVDKDNLMTGLKVLEQITVPDLVVFPDAVALRKADGKPNLDAQSDLYQKTLNHCASRKNRFLIGDIIPGDSFDNPIDSFRDKIGTTHLKYGAVYYPWIYTNYSHQFHLCEFQFFEKDNFGRKIPIRDLSTFTSQSNSSGAQIQQKWAYEALRWNKVIEQMIFLTGIENIGRDDILSLEFWISHAANQLSAENSEVLSQTVKAFFDLVRPILKVFVNLDGVIPPILQALLTKKITVDLIPDRIEQIIAWEKSEPIRTIIDDTRTEEDVNSDFDLEKALSGSPWINQLSVNDIPAAAISSNPAELLSFIRKTITPIAKALAYSVKSLFEEAFAAEAEAETILFNRHPFYQRLAESTSLELKKIPPSSTMAGIYAKEDRETGTWKAPANIRIQATLGPTQHIDDQKQENLNVHTTGKSINVIRAITGRGTRVWGARTLDGNSLEWRYIPVRRYFNFVEEVIKIASESFVFEPNASATWVRIRLFLKTFLTRQWRQGALNGNTPNEAFFVKIGLGETMSEIDVLEGRMIIEIGLAVVRPAEFIVVRHICRMEEV